MGHAVRLFLFLLILTGQSFGQPPQKLSTVQTLKIAYLSKDLSLNSEEAQKFWPVYNNYSDELKKSKASTKEDVIAFEEKSLAIKKKYYLEFKKILNSEERANKVFLSDRNFAIFIKQELMERQRLRSLRQGFGDMDRNSKPMAPQSDY